MYHYCLTDHVILRFKLCDRNKVIYKKFAAVLMVNEYDLDTYAL